MGRMSKPKKKQSVINKAMQKWLQYSPLKRLLVIVGFVITFIGAAIVILVVSLLADKLITTVVQTRKYSAAVARCGTKPAVIVESHALEETDITLYTPLNPQYDSQKTITENPAGVFGGDHVVGYYCSAAEARASRLRQDILPNLRDSTENYSSVTEHKDAYLLADKSIGARFYEPTTQLAGYTVDSTTFSAYNQATFNYLASGATRPAEGGLYDISLFCVPGGNEKNATLYNSSLHVPTATNYYGGTIYYAGERTGETAAHIWDTALPGAECELSDHRSKLTAEQGLNLISSLRAVDYTAYRSFDLVD